jgi:hypothetical protein
MFAYVFKYFRRFRRLFQVFHLYVAKVDVDVTYVAMIKYACCKRMFQCFRRMLQTFFSRCFKCRYWCCTCCKWLYMHVSIACFKYFICLRHILHMFHLDASKVDQVLHMLQWCWWPADSGLPQPPTAAATGGTVVSHHAGACSRQTPLWRASVGGGR